ncbi:hypothetical protein K7J14_15185 [Treponema zuelzerae]|uniref:Uncharacterized protein n=1 Tax=Teretinema zuelzerae TaxID=156 RepID=A0AAE3EJU4_9SPIR|nr:hypothetical protein [Teretinema zuelzerae]MCD1656042.1 hypothetical protein [Teretinema zuelzerae]
MESKTKEFTQKVEDAQRLLIRRIIPWGIIFITFIVLGIIASFSPENEGEPVIGLGVVIGYFLFCIPWLWNDIKNNFRRSMVESEYNSNRPRFGLDAGDAMPAIRSMIFAGKLTLTIFLVPYKVVQTVLIVIKK